jgi:O-antigen ligase
MAMNRDHPALPSAGVMSPPGIDRYPMIVWGAGVVALACAGLYSNVVAAILIACSLAFLFVLPAGWLTLVFFALILGFTGVIDYMPLPLGAFNLYVMDSILVIYVWTIVHMWLMRVNGEPHVIRPPMERRLIALWGVWSALGILFLFYGYYVQHLPFDRAFGEFRRSTVYSMAFFVPLLFPFTQRQLKSLDFAILAGGLLTIAIGVYRLALGFAPRTEENWETGHIAVRWMRIAECVTLAGLVALLCIYMRGGRGLFRKAAAGALVAAAATLMVLSGFRLAMGFVVIAPAMALALFAWARRERMRRMLTTLAVLAAVVAPLLMLMPVLLPDLFDRMLLDLHLRLVNENIQGGFRWWTYQAALERFFDSPIIGHGFGYYLTVPIRNQAGLFDYVEINNPHNMFLAVLYLTGLVGFIPFVLFHGLFAAYAVAGVRAVAAPHRRAYVALLVMYASFVACMCLQPYVSSPFVLMYMIMGFVVRLARPGPNERAATAPSVPVARPAAAATR